MAATGGASGNPVTFTNDATSSSVCSISGSTVTFNGPGRCVIDANQAGNANTARTPSPTDHHSEPCATPFPDDHLYVRTARQSAIGGTYDVAATGGASGKPVTFTIDATSSSVCSISGSTVTFNGPGSCVIDANQAGNAKYQPAAQAQQTITVNVIS